MNKFSIVAAASLLMAVAFMAKLGEANPVAIVSSSRIVNEDGSYSFAYETENGIQVQESGLQKKVGDQAEDSGTASKGSYSYTSPEGQLISIVWTADDINGFEASGDSIPNSPPVIPALPIINDE